MLGFFAPWIVYAAVLALHLLLPARNVDGYVRGADGTPLRYRLNGPLVLGVVLAVYAGAVQLGLIGWDFFWEHRWEGLAGACTLGLLFTGAIVLGAPPTGRPSGPTSTSGASRIRSGRAVARVDAKMFLYLVGAVHARAQRAVVRRAPRARAPGRSVAGRAPLRGAVHLLRRRVPLLRAGAPLHLRLLRRARGLQARLGLPRLLSVLLLRRPLVGRRRSPTRTRPLALLVVAAAALLRRLGALARREPAEVPLQDATRRRSSSACSRRRRSPTASSGSCAAASGGSRATSTTSGEMLDGDRRSRSRSAARSTRGRGSTRSTTWRCSCRGSSTTTAAAPRSTARSGASTAGACRPGSSPGSTDGEPPPSSRCLAGEERLGIANPSGGVGLASRRRRLSQLEPSRRGGLGGRCRRSRAAPRRRPVGSGRTPERAPLHPGARLQTGLGIARPQRPAGCT